MVIAKRFKTTNWDKLFPAFCFNILGLGAQATMTSQLSVYFLLVMYLVRRLITRSKVNVKEKFVLITGCDSGFGRETAIRLDEMGVRVLATCLTKEGEQSLRSVASDKLKTFQMDVTNSQQIKDVYEEVKRQIPCDTGKLKHLFIFNHRRNTSRAGKLTLRAI